MKVRGDFVSNSSSSSFIFVVRDYDEIEHADQTMSFCSLIRCRAENWLCNTSANSCILVDDAKFLSKWWKSDSYMLNSWYGITEGKLCVLPRSKANELKALGCSIEDDEDKVFWNGKDSDKHEVVDLLVDFIAKSEQSEWYLGEFEASDHEGETEIAEEDSWDYVPSNAVWSNSVNNH